MIPVEGAGFFGIFDPEHHDREYVCREAQWYQGGGCV